MARGFNQNQMGFTLDGVPLGDMSYANHNGLHISRAIMSENMGQVSTAGRNRKMIARLGRDWAT